MSTTPLQDAAIETLDDEYFRECVRINPEDIQSEFIRIPADLAYWNKQYADALKVYLDLEIDVKVTKGRVYTLCKDMIVMKGGKPTEEQMKALVESNEDYILVQQEAAAAETTKNRLYGNLDAVRSKKEMLISLGATLRAEMEGDPSLRETVGARRRMA